MISCGCIRLKATAMAALACMGCGDETWKADQRTVVIEDCHTVTFGDCSYTDVCQTDAAFATEVASSSDANCSVQLRLRCESGCVTSGTVED